MLISNKYKYNNNIDNNDKNITKKDLEFQHPRV